MKNHESPSEMFFMTSRMPQSKIAGIISPEGVSGNQNLYKQVITCDSNGDIIHRSALHKVSENGSGFVISYTDKMIELLTKSLTPSALKIFLYVAHQQGYGNPVYGFRCTKKHFVETLKIERSVVWDALKYLRENFLVLESKIDGQSEFMVNPSYITIGSDKKARLREWNRRWEEYFKSTGGKL